MRKRYVAISRERYEQLREAEADCAKATQEWGKAAFLVAQYKDEEKAMNRRICRTVSYMWDALMAFIGAENRKTQ